MRTGFEMEVWDFNQITRNEWVDENILVKPKRPWTNSGNGVLYTALAMIFEWTAYDSALLQSLYRVNVLNYCFKKRGLLMRTPDNKFGLESFDDYLGVAVASLVLKDVKTPREILWYGIKHLGFYNNTEEFTWASWLWRFPHVFSLMWVAAFPFLKWPLYPVFRILSKLNNPGINDFSSIQLGWLFERGLFELGFNSRYGMFSEMLPLAVEHYYQFDHPFQTVSCRIAGRSRDI